jgi:hypothetical protein
LAQALERASAPWYASRTAPVAAAVILACLGWLLWRGGLWETGPADSNNVVHSVPEITVYSADGPRNLSNVLPLRTGDRIAVKCRVSQGQQATILWFNSAGELQPLKPVRDVAGEVDLLTYPGPYGFRALEPPGGTEMIFFCRGEAADDDMRACFPNGVPPLPEQNWLTMIRSKVEIWGPLKSDVKEETVAVAAVMKDIDRKLRRHFDGVTGIAFPHLPAARGDK